MKLDVSMIGIPCIATDTQGKILQANDLMAQLLDSDLNHILGKPLVAFTKFESQRLLFRILRIRSNHDFSSKTSESMLLRTATQNVRDCHISVRWQKREQLNESGGLWLFQPKAEETAASNDSQKLQTKLISAETQIVEMQKELNRTKRTNTEFMGFLSHEMRNPLQPMLNALDTLLETGVKRDQQKLIELCRDSVYHLKAIADSSLNIAKNEAGKIQLTLSDFDLHDMLEHVQFQFQNIAKSKGVELHWSISDDAVRFVNGDRFLLAQVLCNLVGNSLKFTEQGHVKIEVSNFGQTGKTLFTVTDTGLGIEEKYIDSIFEPFSDACNSDSKELGGMGLGLHLSKRLIEYMNGNIAIESITGKGCRVLFTVLLTPGKAPLFDDIDPLENEIIEYQAKQNYSLGIDPSSFENQKGHSIDREYILLNDDTTNNGKSVDTKSNGKNTDRDNKKFDGTKVLIADDNIVVSHALSLQLQKLGCVVDCVRNGEEAVAAASNNNYDLLFLDNKMPILSGVEAAIKIQQLPNVDPSLPIVLLTGGLDKSEQDDCIKAGLTHVLNKPAGILQIKEVLLLVKSA